MKRLLCVLLIGFGTVSGMFAQKQVLKIASIAPAGTPWGNALNKMASEWNAITNGEVELKVYHGGIAGDEGDMLRKLKLGQIQGAALTSFGVNIIHPLVLTLSSPFLVRNDAEFDLVVSEMRGEFDAAMAAKGFTVIAWSQAGWVRFFATEPFSKPEQLKKMKLGTSPSDAALVQVFKELGYNAIPVAQQDSLMALTRKEIDATYTSPLAVGGYQLFGVLKYMTSFRFSPFLGVIVLSNKAWEKIPAKYHAELRKHGLRLEKEVNAEVATFENNVIATMTSYGMKTLEISPADMELWHKDMEKGTRMAFGKSADKATYERIEAILKKARAK